MKKKYIKPIVESFAIKANGMLMTSTRTVTVSSESYDEGTMTDL